MSLFLNSQTGSSDYIRKCNPTTVFSQLTEHAHALNIFYTHALHTHKHTPHSMKTTACFELCAGFPRQILLIYVHSLLSVNKRASVSFCRKKKGFRPKLIFLKYDHNLSNCQAAPISLTQCWPTLHKRDLTALRRLRKMNCKQTTKHDITVHRTHTFLWAASWEHTSRHIKYTTPSKSISVSLLLTGGESLWPHSGEKGQTVGGTEVKIKQTTRVSTAASHSKHESSELRQIETLTKFCCTSEQQLPLANLYLTAKT